MKLIDKAAVVAEIEKRIKEHHSGYLVCLKDILSFLNTLEVKEVDLEKEMIGYFDSMEVEDDENIYKSTFRLIAKHFFELGIKASQKGEML